METLKIRIEKKTNYEGDTYFYLFIDDKYITLKNTMDELTPIVAIAKDVFLNNRDIPQVVFDQTLTR